MGKAADTSASGSPVRNIALLSGASAIVGSNQLILAAIGALAAAAYRPEEAARVQGLNEQVVFGVMALASIASGVLLEFIGWQAINVLTIPVAGLAILALGWSELASRSERRVH